MFRKILIANRGEIACRVIRTARRLGIASIAVYSEADTHARHVRMADEAWPIGPAAAAESYLSIANILASARRSGAEAIHPGYGFLAENADFVEACTAAGIVFIGPPAAAMRAMGSKAAAKALMERSGVPLVAGYHGAAQDEATLALEAGRIGYPVLIKASAGGGGRGMRIVERAADLAPAIGSARREAFAAFGDDQLLIEKFLVNPRHIEIQVFADTHSNVVSLFERDCSIQRRYQKIVEEAPAPGMSAERRRAMGEAAVAAARAVGYVGAGTVEFIVAGEEFAFMEMNTRLQVEHPVTEMITGQDLVEWQLRVAAGERLPVKEDHLGIRGHAIEVRIYAEDPARDFMPSIGRLVHWREPPSGGFVRVDSGVDEDDTIGGHYDAMLAKLIVWGEDRAAAVQRLSRALSECEVVGVATNLDLLRGIAARPAFAKGEIDTGFIARHAADLMGAAMPTPPAAATNTIEAAAALAWVADRRAAATAASSTADPCSPWGLADAWRMNGDGYQDLSLRKESEIVPVRAHPLANGAVRLDLPGGSLRAEAAEDSRGMRLRVDGVEHRLRVVRHGAELVVIDAGRNHVFRIVDPLAGAAGAAAGEERVLAPIPGRVSRVFVKPGDVVKKGAPLVMMEAMKMELTLTAPRDGTVAVVRCALEEMVEEGAELVGFAAAAEQAAAG